MHRFCVICQITHIPQKTTIKNYFVLWKPEEFLLFFKNQIFMCIAYLLKENPPWYGCNACIQREVQSPFPSFLFHYTLLVSDFLQATFFSLESSSASDITRIYSLQEGTFDNFPSRLFVWFIDLLVTSESTVTAESTYRWLKEGFISEEVIPMHAFEGNEKFWPCKAFMWQVPPKLQVKVHPEVLSRDSVKQLYFEVLSWKHLKHSYVCNRVYRLVEIYLPDIWVLLKKTAFCALPTSLATPPGSWELPASYSCAVLVAGGHRSCTHCARCCTRKGQKGCF